ncbi:MAG: carbohydrate-binding domain-containing protein [Kiritimatiellae bacterium]|nr:carbohydrate-binding domain-containing protein [Kiritimatiellia bacterium]
MKFSVGVFALGVSFAAIGGGRPENSGFTSSASVTSSGTYQVTSAATDAVVSGTISGDVSITVADGCRVTLSDATISGTLAIEGDAELWLSGANSISASAESAVTCSGSLTLCGTGTLAAESAGAKKTGVIAVSGDFTLAGGSTDIVIAGSVKNACGVSVGGDYVQQAGLLAVVSEQTVKQNGVFLATKKTSATISGGTLDVTLAGEKAVGFAMDKATTSATMTGGVLRFAMTGDGAKGVKGDGSFAMSGGIIEAELSGGVVEDYFEYEDADEVTWNYYVTLTSSTKTSVNSYATTKLISSGTYPVMDPSKCYAVKVGTLDISGGTVRARATGTAGRGLGADSMTISGGYFDIAVSGGPTDVYVESLVDADDDAFDPSAVTTCLDSGGAACLKTSGTNSVLSITGGTFELLATGDAGKLINAAGYLVIGTEGSSTSPGDTTFSPYIQGRALGEKVYCTAIKQKNYGSLATAVATTDISSVSCSVAADAIVTASGDDVDYSNPKGLKGYSGVAMHGGKIAVYTANDGGEGFESKNDLSISGGVLELVCADDCINSGGDLYIDGGYIYAGSTGNDAIDSNGSIYMTGGLVLAFTSTTPETGIDTDNSSGLVVDGGTLVSFGSAAGNMVVGSSGSLKTYKNTGSLSSSTYAGKYLKMTGGSKTVYVKVPSVSSSTSLSLVCTTDGCTSSAPSVSAASSASGTSAGFHGVYFK